MGNAAIQGDLWGQMPQAWATIQEPLNTPLWEAMLDGALVGEGTRFLDVGCGGGGASLLAAGRGARISGLDAADRLLEIARQRLPEGDFRQGDIEALPFEDGAFDAVFAANSIQFPADKKGAVRELARVCAPSGRIAAGLFGPPEKVASGPILRAVASALPEPPAGPSPMNLSAPGKLEALFESAGLTVIQSGEVSIPFAYPDVETCIRGFLAAGPVQAALKQLGEPRVRELMVEALQPFVLGDGSVNIQPNVMIFVVATK